MIEVWSLLHEDDSMLIKAFQVRIEDEHISRHDVQYDSPSTDPRTNTTAGHTDEAGESDEDSHDDQEPDGSEEDDEDDESVEEDGEAEEPALKYERVGGAAQEFFETGNDTASSLCVGKDSFVSSNVLEAIATSLPFRRTILILAPIVWV